MKKVINVAEVLANQVIDVKDVLDGVPFKGADEEALRYLYFKMNTENSDVITVDDELAVAFVRDELRSEWLIENGVYLDEHNAMWHTGSNLAVGEYELNGYPSLETAKKHWDNFCKRNNI